jgi:hypothetical protein
VSNRNNEDYNRPPSYNQYDKQNSFASADQAPKKANPSDFDLDFNLPNVPTGGGEEPSSQNASNDQAGSIDFDELTRRFQNLKSKK